MPGSTGSRPTRDEVLAKQSKALVLRAAGATYADIARAEHNGRPMYSDRANARKAVLAALEERVTEDVAHLRALESARLDRLQRAIWPAALAGDIDAVNATLRLMDRRARLLGLDMPTKVEVTDAMDEEIRMLVAQLGEDDSWSITGVPDTADETLISPDEG